jgi:flagellar protein FlbD
MDTADSTQVNRMLLMTRRNGNPFYLNPELIRSVEATPDTVVTLLDNTKLLVSEPVEVLVARFIEYQRQVKTPWTPKE